MNDVDVDVEVVRLILLPLSPPLFLPSQMYINIIAVVACWGGMESTAAKALVTSSSQVYIHVTDTTIRVFFCTSSTTRHLCCFCCCFCCWLLWFAVHYSLYIELLNQFLTDLLLSSMYLILLPRQVLLIPLRMPFVMFL